MKGKWKEFISGVLTTAIIFGTIGTAAATTGKKSVELDYNDIKVTMNGTLVNLVDENGNMVEPFAISGTTYLPVRAIANSLGLNVGWDSATSTVTLSSGEATTTQSDNVIYNENGIKISFMGFQDKKEESEYLKGWNIKLKIENSSDKNYTVQVRDLSVNGMMADSIFSTQISSRKTEVDSILVYNLEEKGIEPPITEAEFNFVIFESDDFTKSFESPVITLK